MKYVLKYTVDPGGKELISQLAGELFAKDKLELAGNYGLENPMVAAAMIPILIKLNGRAGRGS